MDRAPRYETVPNEEEDVPAQRVDLAMVIPAPASTTSEASQSHVDLSPPPAYDGAGSDAFQPPTYDIATDLPSYAEAERTKKEMEDQFPHLHNGGEYHSQHIHMDEETSPLSPGNRNEKDIELGTDCMFFLAFITCFMFNWFGLLAVLCLVHTVAGRLGALAGFGLSMVKWAVIIKNNDWVKGHVTGDTWLWWIFLTLGVLLCLRGIVQYIRIRSQWPELAANRRNKIYHFY